MSDKTINEYLDKSTWELTENANFNYSYSGLLSHVATKALKEYALKSMPPKVAKAHVNGDIHIHNLESGLLVPYCHGGSLYRLIMIGIKSPTIHSKPAKHFDALMDHIANYLLISQNEFNGAQAFSDFDTLIAPFIRYDGLDRKQVKQGLQRLVYNLNFTSRQSFQSPFTNLTFNVKCPDYLKDEKVIVGGEEKSDTYSDFQDEMYLVNEIMAEIYAEKDASGRPFTFPLPTINVTKDFPWDLDVIDKIFETQAEFGNYYFMNYVGTGISEWSMRAMCCRLLLDLNELQPRGAWNIGEGTGSLGVVTLNMGKLGFLAKNNGDVYDRLDRLLELAKKLLLIKSEKIAKALKNGLLPFAKNYGFDVRNYFRTIGIIGMDEFCMNYLGEPLSKNPEFMAEVLRYIRRRTEEWTEETGQLFNLEETPGEGSCYRLAMIDKKQFGDDIFIRGVEGAYYYTAYGVPPSEEISLPDRIRVEEQILPIFSGGTIFRLFLGERANPGSLKRLVRKIVENTRIPYIDPSVVISVCPKDKRIIHGTVEKCDLCGSPMETFARVVGYYRATHRWNPGKRQEFRDRKYRSEAYHIEAIRTLESKTIA